MDRKKRNKRDIRNVNGEKTQSLSVKINCPGNNTIIIKSNGGNIEIKANNPRKETSYHRKAKKQMELVDTMQKPNTTTPIENTAKKVENVTEKKHQQKNVKIQHTTSDKVVKPKALLAEINRPKRKQKKDKKDTMASSKENKPNEINEFKEVLYKIFTGYRHMTAKIEKELHKLGFIILRHNKHLILSIVLNEQQYTFPLSATASDRKYGHIIVSKIINTINQKKY